MRQLFFFPWKISATSQSLCCGCSSKRADSPSVPTATKVAHGGAQKRKGQEPKRGFAIFTWSRVVQMGKILDLHIINLSYSYQEFWNICLYIYFALQCVYAQAWERRFSDHHKILPYGVDSGTVQNQKCTHGYLEINCIREYNWCYFSSLKFLQELFP